MTPHRTPDAGLLRLIFILALGTIACSRSTDANDTTEGTGTIELVEVDVAPTVTARAERILVQEGATVRRGDTLAILVQPTLRAQLDQQLAREREASARLRELQRGAREEDIRRAREELDAAESEAMRTARDATRAEELGRNQVISQSQLDASRAAARTAGARRDAARAALDRIRSGARPEELDAARATVQATHAGASAVAAIASDLVLLASVDGVITSRNVEPGEVVTAGMAALTIGQTTRPWVRVFVNQTALPGLRVGQSVTGRLDGDPGRAYAGRIVAINSEAEFTPRVALTEKERADLLFGVKVEFADSKGELKAGLPITVRMQPAPTTSSTR